VTTTRQFEPDRDAPLLSAYVDGELCPEEAVRVEAYLAESPQARREVARLRELNDLTAALRLKDAPPEAWEVFWNGAYNRAERSLGWILLTVGAAIVGGFALYKLADVVLAIATLPWLVKVGIFAGGCGLIALLISVIRERLFVRKRTRYDDVIR